MKISVNYITTALKEKETNTNRQIIDKLNKEINYILKKLILKNTRDT